ncbi:MAG: hypothetical protein HY704_00445 [Gemmatimonadetes bacterium]|nr:hypothetical protein [Gemmatimonadota bacterium]
MVHAHRLSWLRSSPSWLILVGAVLWLLPRDSARAQEPKAYPKVPAELERVRSVLDKYQDPIMAVHDGYFSTLGCVEFPEAGRAGEVPYPAGGMGVHFLNMTAIGPQLDPQRPQILIYEPQGEKLRLNAAEWFVPEEVMKSRPQLWGQPFDGPMEGHHPLMPAGLHHWDLHVWLWKENPAGAFSPTNPAVKCPAGAYTFKERAPKIVSVK